MVTKFGEGGKKRPCRMLDYQQLTGSFLCLGRDSNPHGRFGPRDFKSLVSTIPPPRRYVGPKVEKIMEMSDKYSIFVFYDSGISI